jgi:heat shock protein HtpX
LKRSKRTPGGTPATASLFIVHPFHGGVAHLFSTHPPMEKRIEKLESLAQELCLTAR